MPVTALVTPGPPAGDQCHTDAIARARIGIRRVHRGLLMANQNVLKLVLLEDFVVDEEDRAARITEDVLDSLILQTANDDLGAG